MPVGTIYKRSHHHHLLTSDLELSNVSFSDHASDFIAGLIGGTSGFLAGYPLDTIKVLQQNYRGTSEKKTLSIWRCLVETYRYGGGTRALFKGMASPLAAMGAVNSVYFGVYGQVLKKLMYAEHSHDPSVRQLILASSAAGFVAAVPTSPVELLKIKLQTQASDNAQSRVFRGPVDCARSLAREHGVRSLCRGMWVTIMRDTLGSVTYILTYVFISRAATPPGEPHCSLRWRLLAGGLAGVLMWATLPIDIIKTRLQSDDFAHPRYQGAWQCAADMYRKGGARVFWKGLPITCARAFPYHAITLSIYTTVLQAMQRYFKDSSKTVSDL